MLITSHQTDYNLYHSLVCFLTTAKCGLSVISTGVNLRVKDSSDLDSREKSLQVLDYIHLTFNIDISVIKG